MTSRIASAGSRVARRPLSSLLLCLQVALLAACATAPPREPISDDARRALALLAERYAEFTTMRALADVSLTRGGERQRVQGVLLLRAPSSVRLEALSPFGPPLMVVTVREGQITAYNALKNEAHVGSADSETISKVLRLPLEPDDLVSMLAGRFAGPRDLRRAEVLAPDATGPSLDLVDGSGGRQRVWLDLGTGLIQQRQIYGSQFNALIKYRRDGAGTLAGFDLDAAMSYVTGSVTYRNLVEGEEIDEERFTLAIPKGAKTLPIR
jgi:outer membrane lipoprotein-sorting protein